MPKPKTTKPKVRKTPFATLHLWGSTHARLKRLAKSQRRSITAVVDIITEEAERRHATSETSAA